MPGATHYPIPADLAEVIAVHRDLFGGWTMTAAAPEGAPAAPAEPPATPSQPAAPAAPQPPAQPPAGETPEQTIARLTAELTSARQEAGKSRVNAKQAAAEEARQSLVQELGKALGLVKTDEPVDPAKLTAQLTEQQATAAAAQVQLAVFKAAAKHGADAESLLDSNSFLRSLDGLAPTDADKIDAAIKAAVDANPKLKTAPVAGRSGAEFAGGTGETRKQPTSLDAAVRAAYSTS